MTAKPDSLVGLLMKQLHDPELAVRVYAGVLLGGMGEQARTALPTLLELRQSAEVQDRRLAAMTLGSLAGEIAEAVPPLLDALHDEDEAVRRLAAEALEDITPTEETKRAA